MAHTRANGVFRVTSTENIGGVRRIRRIIVVPDGTATVVIQDTDDNGNQVYEYSGTGRVAESVEIECSTGVRVETANAVVYLYT